MSIQILGIRSFIVKEGSDKGKQKKYDAFFDEGWKAESIQDLLQNYEKYVLQIPEHERWNIFYTIANCGEEKREFSSCDVIPFDIDGLDPLKIDDYINVICITLGIKKESTGIIFTGHGLHFLVGIRTIIKNKTYYRQYRCHYRALVNKINGALKISNLTGKADPAVFDARRILRMPGTINRKTGLPDVGAVVINRKISHTGFNIVALSGIPTIKPSDHISPQIMKKYPKVDINAVLAGCKFLDHVKEKPNEIDEPSWYAALSILGRLDENGKLAHDYSEGYSGYNFDETQQKLEQAVEASGPRKCVNISEFWDGCSKCPNYQKVASPILIHGEDYIKTQHTGFHTLAETARGGIKQTPCFEDLRLFFEKEAPYIGLEGSRMCLRWTGTHYDFINNVEIEEYAYNHFDPKVNSVGIREFRYLVCSTNSKRLSWCEDTTKRKINFLNGILDLDKKALLPHNPGVIFRYVLPYNYDADAKAPVFEKFIENITEGNEEIRLVLEEYMGYCLSNDDCWTHKSLVLVGDGANGKSTWLNTIRAAAGVGNYSSLTLDALNKSEYNRQLLDKKLFNVSEETPIKTLLTDELFKTLVAGGEVQVRLPYQEPYFIRNRAKLMFSCNELPDTIDNSLGFYRRLIIVPFNKTFTNDSSNFDPHIEKKLLTELPGIFNIALKGYFRLLNQQKFSCSKTLSNVVSEYVYSNNSIQRWFSDNVKVIPIEKANGEFAPVRDMYEYYSLYTRGDGNRPSSIQKFTKDLKRLVNNYTERYGAKRVGSQNPVMKKGLRGVEYGAGINIKPDDPGENLH